MVSGRTAAWFFGVAGSLLLVGGLAWWVFQRTQPPGIDTARATLRYNNLAEIRAAEHKVLTLAEAVDKGKGIYRIPVTNAVELFLQLWQDPAAGRADRSSPSDPPRAPLLQRRAELVEVALHPLVLADRL